MPAKSTTTSTWFPLTKRYAHILSKTTPTPCQLGHANFANIIESLNHTQCSWCCYHSPIRALMGFSDELNIVSACLSYFLTFINLHLFTKVYLKILNLFFENNCSLQECTYRMHLREDNKCQKNLTDTLSLIFTFIKNFVCTCSRSSYLIDLGSQMTKPATVLYILY